MSFELPFLAAARQWWVFKVVGRSTVIKNVPFF
jgi:3-mercaptopyruvate sulfurtransferase SseA